jgi:TctA family transporter
MLEENFITSMIKAEGNLLEFVARPIAATLAAVTVLVWFVPIVMRGLRTSRSHIRAH